MNWDSESLNSQLALVGSHEPGNQRYVGLNWDSELLNSHVTLLVLRM